MKVSDIIIYIMKIMWRDLKKFLRVVSDIQKTVKSPNFEWSYRQVVKKRVSQFQHRTNENTPKFPTIEIVIYNVFIK